MDWSRFKCPCGRCRSKAPDAVLVSMVAVIEKHYQQALYPTSGYRCAAYNSEVGGSSASPHLKAKALDFVIPGYSPSEIYGWIHSQFPDKFGLGVYDSHVHFDVRKDRARWDHTHAKAQS